jgi:hypothetical protein
MSVHLSSSSADVGPLVVLERLEIDLDPIHEVILARVVHAHGEQHELLALRRAMQLRLHSGQQHHELAIALPERRVQLLGALARLVDHEHRPVPAREAVVRARPRVHAAAARRC